jgi:lipid II:glycine glycyltransferase (peptidoglycan interpeptide bridge formation enzyme)
MYLSQYKGSIIAGGVMEYYKDRIIYGYGAADPKHLDIHPYNAFIWKSIEDACGNGYQIYDFGRTSYDNAGLIQFKKRWGARERRLCYSDVPSQSIETTRDSIMYRLGSSVIRVMPMSAYKAFSTSIFRHFG